ncbi:GTPase [uncultured Acinetobacter sp.]|uniref:GTPase domain-containing protein n=1 Tax=uncultured Acinetobacter sp. TaxID=165433 RepID=UPI002621284D|nr:GTPase [uncultured Acinetobacter sp.]
MTSHVQAITDCVQECLTMLKDACDLHSVLNLDLDELEQQILKELEFLETKVTILGSYNAGKSTLVNVLLGKRRAPINNSELDHGLECYWWRDIQLVDTPSLYDVAHNKNIDMQHFINAQQIIFVVRDYEVESRRIYEALTQILMQHKRLAIVLNHQLPVDQVDQVDQFKQRFLYHLHKYAAYRALSPHTMMQVPILSLNLKIACRARHEKNETLLKHTGYLALRQGLMQWLDTKVSQQEKIQKFQQMLEQQLFLPIDRTLKSIGVKPEQLRSLYRSKLQLEQERIKTRTDLRHFIEQQVFDVHAAIIEILQQPDVVVVEHQLQQLYEKLQQQLFLESQKHLQVTNQTVLKRLNAKLDALKQEQAVPSQIWYESVLKQGQAWLGNFSEKSSVNLSSLLSSGKIPSLSGLTRHNLGGMAAQVFFTAYDAYQAHQKEQHNNRRARILTQARQQVLINIQQDMHYQLLEYVEHVIENSYNQKLLQMQTTLDQLLIAEEKYQEIVDQFAELYDEFKQLKGVA